MLIFRKLYFVAEAIQELIQKSKISEVNSSDLSNINPFSVSIQPCGKKRLIHDLRLINQHLYKFNFKYEDYKKVLGCFKPGGFAINFDLKSGYHHLDICPHHRQYSGFAWSFPDGTERFFMCNVLSFGLYSAPYIFTKLFRPLIKYWRSKYFHSVVYLDDGFDIEDSFERADYASHHIKGDLCASGFVINEGKSNWIPIQKIDWLGISWDCEQGTISIKHGRILKASIIDNILSKLAFRFWTVFVFFCRFNYVNESFCNQIG